MGFGEPAVCSAGASSSNASRTIALLRAETAAVGVNVRLEQERIAWNYAWDVLLA